MNNQNDGPSNSSSSQVQPVKLDGYKFNQLIGKGSYGQVYKAEKKETSEVVAIKCVPLKSLGRNSRENILTEISILKKLSHPFIVHMLDFQWDKAFIYLIFELCTGGELASIIRLKRTFPEEIVQHFLQQLASALKYLRDNNIAHLDLKPNNILITGIQFVALLSGLNSFKVWRHVILKIADFGFSQYLDNDDHAESYRGSPLYMAPEIFKKQRYDARVDLWSLGIILYECLFGRTPLHGKTVAQITSAMVNNQFKIEFPKNNLTKLCLDLLKSLLKVEPNERISFSNFFSHPFIDLEHMPTKESFQKATEKLKSATDFEEQGLLKSAFYNFREALLYLMPLYRWGVPDQPMVEKKRNQIRSVIEFNMKKAEELQQKCGIVNIDSDVLGEIQNIYNLVDRARDLTSKDLYEQALDKWELAIELSLKIMQKCNSKVYHEFFSDINDWMAEAESAKEKFQEQESRKKIEKSRSPARREIQEEVVLAKEVTQFYEPEPDWYLKLKEPSKTNEKAHSKLKLIEANNQKVDIDSDTQEKEEEGGDICLIH